MWTCAKWLDMHFFLLEPFATSLVGDFESLIVVMKMCWHTLHHFAIASKTGVGNSNPPQYSCLKNSEDWGTWWAAVYGVAVSHDWAQ